MLGAYAGYAASIQFGFWTGVVFSVVVLAVLGALLDRLVFRPLQNVDHMITVLVTYGLLPVFEDFVHTVWGADLISVQVPALLSGTIGIGDTQFPIYRLAVISVAVAVALGLSAWLHFSRAGLYVRASSVDSLTTAMQGVDTERLSIGVVARSEEHTSELQSLMRISYAVFCLQKKTQKSNT